MQDDEKKKPSLTPDTLTGILQTTVVLLAKPLSAAFLVIGAIMIYFHSVALINQDFPQGFTWQISVCYIILGVIIVGVSFRNLFFKSTKKMLEEVHHNKSPKE